MKKILILAAVVVSVGFTSCLSAKNDFRFIDVEKQPNPPALVTEIPVVEYRDPGIKYEVESMYLHNLHVSYDKTASQQFAVRVLSEASYAQMKVKLPAGTFECLVNECASDPNHAAFYVCIDNEEFRVYPSNPPTGSWELTRRAPVYFTIDEPRTILVTIQSNSERKPGSTGMLLDYIQFIKYR